MAEDARFAATAAAAGLALSYGYWVQGADVEAYAAAVVALLATLRLVLAHRRRPTALRALAVGLALGAAVLFHLTHVCLSVLVAVALSRCGKRSHALLALATGGLLSLGAYAYAALLVRGHDLAAAVRWVATATHGFHQSGGVYRLADAVYGLAKAVIWSPYLYEADAPKLLGQFLLGFLPLVALVVWGVSRSRALAGLDGKLGLAWIAPYALLGVLFFGSDSERWLFVLPAGWLVVGMLLAATARRAQRAAFILAYVAALNLATGILPAHRDNSIRRRAEAVAAQLHDGDTVIFPGHSWDEYVSFYAKAEVWPVPLVYYAARDGQDGAWQRLFRELASALMRDGNVYVLRLDDDGDARGWSELAQLGVSRAQVRERLGEWALLVHEGELVRLDPRLSP